jgi:ABC-type sugar transport system ATPase subunit
MENVFIGTQTSRLGLIDRSETRRRFATLADKVPFRLDPDAEVRTLSIADQQKVEIFRALAREARLIVMDEPTSSLGREESDVLHDVVRRLCAEHNTAVVYVSHFLEEILGIADHFTILRAGRLIETIGSDEATLDRLVSGMLGQAVSVGYPAKAPADTSEVLLSLRGVSRAGAAEDIDLDIRRGEIVGLAGLVGSGRTEIARMIFGADTPDRGEILVDGVPLRPGSPRHAVAAGVGFVPEDRATQGLVLELSQRINVTLAHPETTSRAGMPVERIERTEVARLLAKLRVDPIALDGPVRALSGGNQQKVLFARWLVVNPKVLLLDEPTRGVDVGAKWAIYELIVALAAEGIAVLLISSEAEEVVGLAHRVVVMRRGRVVASYEGDDVQFDPIMQAALGV